ncbi:MAG: bifunctional phosphoribosyl-AMP cyclohydrolase/phosphoribosyl-ATP diphosphatase HisIE [Herpetosiphon sp.]
MDLQFNDAGLIPAVVQHARTGEVLMLGYMNQAALTQTQSSGLVTFWSRSRRELWQKGATSGNVLRLVELRVDCDADALLVLAEPAGPTCHTGARSCFYRGTGGEELGTAPPGAVLGRLEELISERRAEQREGSYTVKLLNGGVDRIAKKVGEEATEVVIGAMKGDNAELTAEVADLLYHTWVLLQKQGLPADRVWAELERRYAKGSHDPR